MRKTPSRNAGGSAGRAGEILKAVPDYLAGQKASVRNTDRADVIVNEL
jgi:hypothetical protein